MSIQGVRPCGPSGAVLRTGNLKGQLAQNSVGGTPAGGTGKAAKANHPHLAGPSGVF